jgi:hypothetical protein
MNYAVMIAAAFILATIAVAALSPFDHLPQGAPQATAAATPPPADQGSYSDDSSSSQSDSSSSSPSDSVDPSKWPPNEAPPH